MSRGSCYRLMVLAIAASLLVLAGCGGSGTATSGGTSQVTVSIGVGSSTAAPGSAAPRAIPPSVALVVFTISGEGMETVVRTVATAGMTQVVETFSIPKGLARTFRVEAYDGAGILRYLSVSTFDILDNVLTLPIVMSIAPGNPGLNTWAEVNNPTSAPNLSGMAFGGGSFVAVGESDGAILVSTDNGATWTNPATLSPPSNEVNDIAYGDGTFVAVGGLYTPTSYVGPDIPTVYAASQDNLALWTLRADGIVSVLRGVAFGGGTFVAVGNGGAIYWSDNVAAGWTLVNPPPVAGATLFDVAYGNGTFVAVGDNALLTSGDGGRNWQARDAGGLSYSGVGYASGVFLALAYDPVYDVIQPYYSMDEGATWTATVYQFTPIDGSIILTSGGGQFVVVNSYGEIWLPSAPVTDPASTWAPVVNLPWALTCGTAGNGRYVVGGYSSYIYRSDQL
ncbi:MAG: sialidase family protein [Deltaproteobacteria bacterium]|nr:sialidase family protein [Deltaproteobacteria bacterium]